MENSSKMRWVGKALFVLILAMALNARAAKNPELTSEAYAVLDNGTLTFKYDDQKPSGAFELNTGANTPGWNASAADITKVVFDPTFASCYPVSCYFWFKDCKKLTEIQGIENLNTRDVTNMKAMFQDCQVLGDIDLSQFVTDKVTDMSCMFRRCNNMQIFDFSNFNTSAVTNFESMFEACAIIVELDLSGFDISSAESIQCMFSDCQNLQRLNLRLFDTKNVTNMKQIFQSCLNLGTIYASKDWVIGSSTNTTNMFDRCGRVKGGAGTTFVTSDAAYAIIDQGESAPGYFTAATITQPDKKWMLEYNGKPQALLKYGTIGEFLYKLGADGEYGRTVPRATNVGDYTVYYKSVDNSIPETAVNVSIAKGRIRLVTAPAATPRLLYSGEPKPLVTKGVPSVGEIVYSLDGVSYSATVPTATDAGEYTVYYKVDGDENYIGISPTRIKSTIYTEVQEDWTPEWYALYKDGTLTFYYDVFKPLEGAFTSYDDYNDAYDGRNKDIAESITKVVFDDSFANYRPTSCESMFFCCINLTEIEGIKNLNTENVTSMSRMFSNCLKLAEIDLSGFNTAKVTSLQSMFFRCRALTELDLSSFNTSALASYASQYEWWTMLGWFSSCSNLKTIYVNDYWDMSNVKSSNMKDLFFGSPKLVGGNGTLYTDIITNSTENYKPFAVIDKAGQPGLLTYKKAKASVIAPKQKTLTYNGGEQPLVSGLSTNFGTILYRLGSEGEYSEEIPTATDAKEYTVYYKVADGDKFTGTEGSITVTIAKAKNRWKTTPAATENLVYTGENLALATDGTPTFGKAVYSLDGKTYSETLPAVADAGTYTVHYKVDGGDDFDGIEASSFEVTIDKAVIEYTQAPAGVGNLVYSGSEQALVSAGTANAGSILYSLDGENYGKEVPTAANTGSYTVYYKVDGDNNHTGIEPASINVSIAKKQITITEAPEAVEDLVYSGKEQALVTAGKASDGKIIYSLNGVGYSDDIPTATDAGEYTVYYQVLGNDNYIGAGVRSVKASIAKQTITFAQAPEAVEGLVYSGEAQALVTAGTASAGKIIYSRDGISYSEAVATATDAGEYTVYYKVNGDDNCNGTDTKTIKVGINKAQSKLTTTPAAISGLVYNGKAQALVTAGESTFGAILYSIDGNTYTETIPTAVSTGEYTVYYKVETTDNYDGIEPKNITVSITDNKTAYAVIDNGTATFYFNDAKPADALPLRNGSDDNNWNSDIRSSITKVVFDESFKGYKPYKTSSWFWGFSDLTEISGMENINTEDLEYMDEMFQFCDNLKSVDLSGFNTAKVTDMTRLFWGCGNLEYVIAGEGWNTSALKKSTGMFEDCFKIHGGKGTAYNADYTDATYARTDGADTPGYFTQQGEPVFHKAIVAIEVSASPEIEYTEGDEFSADNGKLTVKYNDSTTETIDLSAATITGYDKTKTGEQTLKIEYQGAETSLSVTVKEKTPTPVSAIADKQNINVWTYDHTLYINAPADTEYKIIDLSGRVLKTSATTSTREEISINNTGVVIVIINEKAFKVAL